jgi:hypothetical protein
MLISKKSLGQKFCNHIFCVTIDQLIKVFFNLLSHQMMMDFDMFYVGLKDWVLQDKDLQF